MRVIAGKVKGHRLKSPKGLSTRPMLEKVREALFSILQNRVPGSNVLDLYAGTGAVGIEALSRGAKWVDFVDINPEAVKVIKDNLFHTKFEKSASVFCQDVANYLGWIKREYDLIFFTPPYRKVDIKVIKKVAKVLEKEGLLIVQYPKDSILPEEIGNFISEDKRVYGRTAISFYKLS